MPRLRRTPQFAALLVGALAWSGSVASPVSAGTDPAGTGEPAAPSTPAPTPEPTVVPTPTPPPSTSTSTSTTSTTTTSTTSTTVPAATPTPTPLPTPTPTASTAGTTTTTEPDRTTTTAAPVGPECRPPTTTTTTTTIPEPTTTTTTTTTTLPGETTTTSTTTTTIWLPDCPTTSTVTATSIPEEPPPPPDTEPGQPDAAPLGVPVPQELGDILTTIRLVESGSNYTIGKNRGGASGAYQYIDSTWGKFKGYPSAYLAPPAVQDEKALADVQSILWTWKGDVSMVPVIWYYPKAASDPALMDLVPMPRAGNRLTVREYQLRWLEVLAQVTGNTYPGLAMLLPPDLRFLAGIPPELTPGVAELWQIAYPVLGASVVAPPVDCQAKRCEEGTDAIVYGQKLQPILVAADGVVTAVSQGDTIGGQLAVTITDTVGRTYRYTGFNNDTPSTDDGQGHPALALTTLAQVGTVVHAGQVIGFMGDTDPMPLSETRGIDPDEQVWPHLRLQIRDADGVRMDADRLVIGAQNRQACHVGTGPWALGPDARLLNPDDDALAELAQAVADRGDDPAENPALRPDGYPQMDPVVVDAVFNGGFLINADGTVQANGNSALILHPLGCTWEPDVAFGYGASGTPAPLRFLVPIELPARYWVTGAIATREHDTPGLPATVFVTR